MAAVQDNTLYESPSGRLSNGSGSYLFSGLTNEQVKRRTVIAFKNFGWILVGDETTRSTNRFDSRENSIVQNRLVLEISYTVTGTPFDYSGTWFDPTPDSLCWMAWTC